MFPGTLFFFWWDDPGMAPPFTPATRDYRIRWNNRSLTWNGQELTWGS